ncbi:MAG: isoprenylcysteine carboxylmethyltransferase family protein [Bacteroidetes bacterium]|nr:MAG: isoprenylcysteine carboxylmethyltransferase family protein [Bacteroidota bacterium]REK07593.1 MAG: isoprenylcysteine carboxylmethyltransferase family protein [Bacteroidota bacterium]REK36975.1 MAG: isoprenylcysteine carboxylmethyltransferase family protein [Bacteroidota bacterium]REK47795.1 MAG: isoprenylcysteine carboxylmethyltransferase family protein [Bacteroidota bacterium]
MKARNLIVTLLQFLLFFLLAFSGELIPKNYFLVFFQFISVVFALWAFMVMRGGTFSIFPEVRKGAALILRGPYKYIRHPMYTALLLISLCWLLDDFSWFRVIVFILLSINMRYKIYLEEAYLKRNYPEYRDYMKESSMLIPFIY